jgi:hypothetical protein
MKLNFCTLFDSNFLVMGYTMYTSLQKYCKNFHLYIFAFDDLAFEVLTQLNLPNVTVIALQDFEDEELLRVKPTRTKGEYCWTCTGSTIKYCIEKFQLDHCTYVEADMYFYANPVVIVQELYNAGKDVLITSHNYTKKHQKISKITGEYCVQFMIFKNTTDGMTVLNWWRNACIDWCYNRIEDGKFGDQKYLDEWLSRFSCVHVSTLLGAGIAPWNAIDYNIFGQPSQGDSIQLINRKKKMECDLIFYHFHKFRLFENQVVWERGYSLPAKIIDYIYVPYTNLCLTHYNDLCKLNQNIGLPPKSSWLSRSFFSKTLYFIAKIFYSMWKEKRLVVDFNNYHIYKIRNNKLIK